MFDRVEHRGQRETGSDVSRILGMKPAPPPDIPIVAYVPSDKSELKPGVKIFIFAAKKPDGTLEAPRVDFGKDGLTPPM